MKWRVSVGAVVVVAIGYTLRLLKKTRAPRPESGGQRSIPAAWVQKEKA
jgi:hypothetical protein